MLKLTAKQSGFGTVTVLTAILIIVAIGGIGFFIHNRNTRTAPAGATTDNSPAPSKAVTEPNPATPTSNGAVLVVKEWGITIPLPDSLKDAYYVPSTGSADPDGSVDTIWLGLKSKDTETCGAALGNTGGSVLGGVVRGLPTDTDPVTGKTYPEFYPQGTQIGKYYYGFGASLDQDNKCGSVVSRSDINTAFGIAVKQSKASTE